MPKQKSKKKIVKKPTPQTSKKLETKKIKKFTLGKPIWKDSGFVAFVLVFIVIGSYMLFHSLAASSPLVKLQFEHMHLPSSASVYADKGASNGKAVKMPKTGHITTQVNMPTSVGSFDLKLKAKSCGGEWPIVTIKVSQQYIFHQKIDSTVWKNYGPYIRNFKPGRRQVYITYTVPQKGDCSAVLYGDVIRFYGANP